MSEHIVPVFKLVKLLQDLAAPYPSASVVPNAVGNLAILDHNGQYVGFIDMDEMKLDLFPEIQNA